MEETYFKSLWNRINSGITLNYGVPSRYSIYTLKVKGRIDEAMEILRSGNTDYIFVHGVCIDGVKREAIGLLCTNGIRSLADIDTVFFVGYTKDLTDDKDTRLQDIEDSFTNKELSIMPLSDLEYFLTDRAKYRIGSVVLISEEIASIVATETFINAVHDLGRGNDWDE